MTAPGLEDAYINLRWDERMSLGTTIRAEQERFTFPGSSGGPPGVVRFFVRRTGRDDAYPARAPPEYRIEVEFDAPLEFVFRWYADCRSDDTVRVGEHYEQWILRRSRNRVLYEDLRRARDGW